MKGNELRTIASYRGVFYKPVWGGRGRCLACLCYVKNTSYVSVLIEDRMNIVNGSKNADFVGISPYENWLIFGIKENVTITNLVTMNNHSFKI